jgi:hypothetical protein
VEMSDYGCCHRQRPGTTIRPMLPMKV